MSVSSSGDPPDWTQLYEAALLELDPTKLRERIDAAHAAIESRISELPYRGSKEALALKDAQRNLRTLLRRAP